MLTNCSIMAYGGFNTDDLGELFMQALQPFAGHMVSLLLVYVAASATIEFCRYRIAGIGVYFVGLLVVIPSIGAKGAPSPYHVAVEMAGWSLLALTLTIIVKCIWYSFWPPVFATPGARIVKRVITAPPSS